MPRTAPGWTILAFTLVGLLMGRLPGAALGLVAGIVVVLLIGAIVRRVQGGVMPAKVRRSLVINLIAQRRTAVLAAFPNLDGDDLFQAVSDQVENLARRAATTASAPTHEAIWTPNNVSEAVTALIRDSLSPENTALFLAILSQINKDWNTHPAWLLRVLDHREALDLGAGDYILVQEIAKALGPSMCLQVGSSVTGPTLEIVPSSTATSDSDPVFMLSGTWDPDTESGATLAAVHPAIAPVVSHYLESRGFSSLSAEPGLPLMYVRHAPR